ncbi:IPT/TIG domain-containing protein [Actinosynnema sp. NPDC023587]|uniref:IPT/TIG domain-containing protein n=1 Tax=Actinosynnema sp. NPDC023587 TaxID=3154695 RepID=UPI00340BD2CB
MTDPRSGPHLDSITPKSGGTGGGEKATLQGSLLSHVVTVTFGGSAATGVSATINQVDCTTPAHPAGVVKVTATDDQGNVSNPVEYTYK